MIPVFRAADVERAVSPHEAYDAVRGAFEAHARAAWSMPSKVYVSNYPAGDFRAMPAIGDGHALLKWGRLSRPFDDGGNAVLEYRKWNIGILGSNPTLHYSILPLFHYFSLYSLT